MFLGFHYNFRLAVLINFVLIIKKSASRNYQGGEGGGSRLIQTLSESLSFLIKMLPLLLCVSS